MSELDDFLKWGGHVNKTDDKDSFGHMFKNNPFPYGSFAYWIEEYKRSKGIK